MMPGWFWSVFKAIISITLIILIAASLIVGTQEFSLSLGVAVYSSADGILDEMIGYLPGIGFVIQSGISFISAQKAEEPAEVSVFLEAFYAFILFCAYGMMEKINAMIDRMFSSLPYDTGWIGWICSFSIKLAEIIGAVIVANLFSCLGERLMNSIGVYASMGVLLGVIVLAATVMLLIGKRKGIISTVIDSISEVVVGMIVVCLIYIVVLCIKIMSVMESPTVTEWVITTSGFIISMLALVLVESNAFAKGLSEFLSSRFDK